MHRFRLLVLVIGVLVLLTTGTSVASAGPSTSHRPEVGYLAPITWNSIPGTATVLGSYRCWPPARGSVNHLWVSIKQGGPDPTAGGSSSTVNAWYDTNISHDVAVTCNGQWQTRTVTLGKHATDFSGRPLGQLKDGRAWLQFCLVQGPENGPNGIVASRSRWVQAIGFRSSQW